MEEKKTFLNKVKDFFKKFWRVVVSIAGFILGGVITALGIKSRLDKKQIKKNEEIISRNEELIDKAKETNQSTEEVIKKNEEIIKKYTKKDKPN